MTDLPDVRIKAVVNFPAIVIGGTGISVSKDAGTYTFDIDYSEIAQVTTVPTGLIPTTSLLLWESTQGVFYRIALADFKPLLASMP